LAAIKASRADRTDYRRTRAPQFAQKEAAGVNGAPQLRQASPTDANGGPPVGADASRAGAIDGGGLGYMPAYGGKAGDIGALRPRPLSVTTKITPTMSSGTPMQRKGTKTTPTIEAEQEDDAARRKLGQSIPPASRGERDSSIRMSRGSPARV